MSAPLPLNWRSRIVRHADVSPEQLLASPKNWRIHPRLQQDAMRGALARIGWIDEVKCQEGTDVVVDGHMRVALAISAGEPTVPVAYLDLSDEEVDFALATLDPIGAMAVRDDEMFRDVLASARLDDELFGGMLRESGMGDDGQGFERPEKEEFVEFDEGIETEHECPNCHYRWSGGK